MHSLPTYTLCNEKRYLYGLLIKLRSIKLCTFISRLQELNAYFRELLLDIQGQENTPLPTDEIMDIIFHSMSTIQKNKLTENEFDYFDYMTKKISAFF